MLHDRTSTDGARTGWPVRNWIKRFRWDNYTYDVFPQPPSYPWTHVYEYLVARDDK
jgi:hypothetical protein